MMSAGPTSLGIRRRTRSDGRPVQLNGAAVLILAAVIALLAWITMAASARVPSFDGSMNLQVAWSLSEGEGFRRTYAARELFPHEIQTNAPYLIPAALAFKAFGLGLWQAQLANLLYLYAFVAAAFWLLYRRFGLFAGAAAALLIATTPGIIAFGLDGYGEIPALFWSVAGLLLFPWANRPRSDLHVGLAGLCLGMAVSTKYVIAISSASFGLCFVVALLTDQQAPPGTRLRRIVWLGIGFLLPVAAQEFWRWLALGGSAAYQSWWALELGAIGHQAGLKPVGTGRISAVGANLNHLSEWYGLPRPAVLVWLAGPYVMAAWSFVRMKRLRANGALVCFLLAAAIYFGWWLYLTPPEKAWHRRIIDGSLLLNLGWAYAASLLAENTASARRTWQRKFVAAPMIAMVCLAAVFFNANARATLAAPPNNLSNFRRAVAILRALPNAQVYAIGWNSAGALSLLADRPFLDFNDTIIARVRPGTRAILAVDTAALSTGAHRAILSMYPARALLPEGSNPQLYELDVLKLKPMAGDERQRTPVVDLTNNRYPFVQGFHPAEVSGTRWMTSDGAVGLRYDGNPLLAITAYAPGSVSYSEGKVIGILVSIDGCPIGRATITSGSLRTLRLRIPQACRPQIGHATTVRLSADNLILSRVTYDARSLSIVLGKVGFVPSCSGTTCQDWPVVIKGPALAPVARPVAPETTASIAASPNPVNLCDKTTLPAVDIAWSVPRGANQSVSIWVSAPGVTPKLWLTTGSGSGIRKTGPWVGDGTRFELADSSRRQLAVTIVKATRCPLGRR